ncbi:STAS-like domain-containing protein [Clostridium perfringens]|uniref:STAS-like domain-containing protein n=1 Tax=Clostridium perfringens TaxID=1502 RepID=UPI001A3302FA|nr:STAS-like domain-containing protein [Clostridium perfringens]EJT6478249.1 STAS-like domain-containing protein [Clostridium perfringens]MDK0563096.1 STAS-like domain-containing protein [Clostridium perfringens]MDK0662898.1 STAS-like domain-containing protein [Clostridium perfringens]MDK0899307.1 STAS-like domain-containing protein [Clostridium perfringens]MDM0516889.1 STAS-like domain-containing protein [Clostridium perfringens]
MIIKFQEFGESLGTRILGNEIRCKIEDCITKNEEVIFDFGNVSILSNSFVDECIGKLFLNFSMDEIKQKTKFTNVNSINKKVILKVLNDRAKQQ